MGSWRISSCGKEAVVGLVDEVDAGEEEEEEEEVIKAAGPVAEGPKFVLPLPPVTDCCCCFLEGGPPRIQPSTKRTSRSGSRPAAVNCAAMDRTVDGAMAFMSAK